MTGLSQEKELPSRTSLLQWFICRYRCTDLSLLAAYSRWSCLTLPVPSQFAKNTDILMKARSAGLELARINHSHCRDLIGGDWIQLKPPLFSVWSHHRKKPNVCLLSPISTSSLSPLPQSSPPFVAVLLAEPARTDLHAAVQRQPQRPQPYQLPQLLPWSVLPAADRTDQRDSEPWGQWPLAVCCQGLGVLHCGSKGKVVVSDVNFRI